MNEKDRQIGAAQFAALFSGRIPYRDEMAYYLDENVDVTIARILRLRANVPRQSMMRGKQESLPIH
jgi:hypothetical protein